MGGARGEGEQSEIAHFLTPTLTLPHPSSADLEAKGGNIGGSA
jgi:hypothetical protein